MKRDLTFLKKAPTFHDGKFMKNYFIYENYVDKKFGGEAQNQET